MWAKCCYKYIVVVHPSRAGPTATPGDLSKFKIIFETNHPVTVTNRCRSTGRYTSRRRWVNNTTSLFLSLEMKEWSCWKPRLTLTWISNRCSSKQSISSELAAGIGATQDATSSGSTWFNEILYQRRYSLWAEALGSSLDWCTQIRSPKRNFLPVW